MTGSAASTPTPTPTVPGGHGFPAVLSGANARATIGKTLRTKPRPSLRQPPSSAASRAARAQGCAAGLSTPGAAWPCAASPGEYAAPEYVDIGSFIDQRAGYRDGRPFIVGTGVTVDRISVLMTIDEMSPAEIADAMGISLPQVHAAIAFYLANRVEIEAAMDAADAAYDAAVRGATK